MGAKLSAPGPKELRQLRIECGLSVPEAAQKIGVNRATWWRWEEKGVEVPEGKIRSIWDLRGKDFPGPKAAIEPSVQVPIYSLKASAGPGTELGAEWVTGHIGLDREYVRNMLQTDPANVAAITIDGDSMEPAIRSGEIVLMARTQSGASIGDGIHLLRLDGALLCKRLGRLPGHRLTVTSDNPAAGHSYEINLKDPHLDFAVIGRVVGVLRRL